MTQCPKCGFNQQQSFDECPRCGIVVRKYRHANALRQEMSGGAWVSDPLPLTTPAVSLLTVPVRATPAAFYGRLLLWVPLAVWSVLLFSDTPVTTGASGSFLHLVNLPFHEAGHVVFSVFGDFIGSLGGSLGQLLVPLICGLVLLMRSGDSFGAAIAFWWFGENFLDLSPYIYDARAGRLPLLGGNTGETAPYGFHDWNYLLSETGLLAYDHEIAWAVHLIGVGIMLLGVAWCGVYLLQQKDRVGWE